MRVTTSVLAALLGTSLLFGLAGPAFGDHDDGPEVKAHTAASVTTTGAHLRGYVKPEDDDARYRFQYGTTTGYGVVTPWQSLRESDSWYLVTAPVAGLQPGTTYHYRVVASDDDGDEVAHGADGSFTTGAASPSPVISPFPVGPQTPVVTPAPKLGKSLGVAPRGGSVTVRRPGKRAPVPLKAGAVVPVGSLVDATRGSLALTSALPSGKTQTGNFGGGKFTVRQGRGGYVDLYLRGTVCGPTAKRTTTSATASRRKRSKRRLFGSDRGGRFRTHGRNSHATVRGTRWTVEDSCKGTLTKVSEGSVVVRDFAKKKRVLVKAGGRYLARPRR